MIRTFTIVFAALLFGVVIAPAVAQPVAAPDPGKLKLASANAIVIDAAAGTPLYAKAADEVTPIASLTKLMTAMVTLDAGLPMDEPVAVDIGDLDYIKGTRSRLRHGGGAVRGAKCCAWR